MAINQTQLGQNLNVHISSQLRHGNCFPDIFPDLLMSEQDQLSIDLEHITLWLESMPKSPDQTSASKNIYFWMILPKF